eukprot:4254498-Amphidinium_carterae.1
MALSDAQQSWQKECPQTTSSIFAYCQMDKLVDITKPLPKVRRCFIISYKSEATTANQEEIELHNKATT